MVRMTIILALTAAVLGLSVTGSTAQSSPPNFSEDYRMSMCRAWMRSSVPKCACILKTMRKYLTTDHINLLFWLNYDNPTAAKAYLAERRKKDPQLNRKYYNASYPGWIEAQKNCTFL